jgi:hypothetical protein
MDRYRLDHAVVVGGRLNGRVLHLTPGVRRLEQHEQQHAAGSCPPGCSVERYAVLDGGGPTRVAMLCVEWPGRR